MGKYVLGQPIARGGMAEVWSAQVEGPQGFVKPLALKFILDAFAGDSELERLFVNEARVAAQLQHANLVSVFDFGTVEEATGATPTGRYYIAMERVEGRDLRRVLQGLAQRRRRMPISIALYIAGEVLKGLRYVHERRDPATRKPLQLIHRDVSPHNVLIGRGGEVKLSDFGIAKAMSQSLGTRSGMMRGKLAYAPPEQVRAAEVDHRADQFALGVTLWEMLAERRLFEGADERDIVGRVLRGTVPRLPRHLEVAPDVEQVVRRMLASSRESRFASTAAALSALSSTRDYSSDGAPLAELLQQVFPEEATEPAATAPLLSPKPARPAALPELRTCTLLAEDVEIVGTAAAPLAEHDVDGCDAGTTSGGAYVSEIDVQQPPAAAWRRRPARRAGTLAVGVAAAAGLLAWRLTYSGATSPRRERRSPAASSPLAGPSQVRSRDQSDRSDPSAARDLSGGRAPDGGSWALGSSAPPAEAPPLPKDDDFLSDDGPSNDKQGTPIAVHAEPLQAAAGRHYENTTMASFRYPPMRARLTAGRRPDGPADDFTPRQTLAGGLRHPPVPTVVPDEHPPLSGEPSLTVTKRANGAPILE